jgi:Trehalose receptor
VPSFLNIFFAVLAMAQFFGLFPFVGVFARNIKKVQFKWISLRTIHSSFWLASALTFAFLELSMVTKYQELNAKNIS